MTSVIRVDAELPDGHKETFRIPSDQIGTLRLPIEVSAGWLGKRKLVLTFVVQMEEGR